VLSTRQNGFLADTKPLGTWSRVSAFILRSSLYIFVAVSLLDPADQIFHLKTPLFIVVFGIWLLRLANGYTPNCRIGLWIGVICFGLMVPLVATLIGAIGGTNPAEGIGLTTLKSFLMLFLLPVIVSENIDLVSILVRESILVALITIGLVLVRFISPLLFIGIYEFTLAKQNALISTGRDQFGIGIGSFYYKTAAIMIISLGHYSWRFFQDDSRRFRDFLLILIYLSALVFSGARGNAFGALIVIGLFGLQKIKKVFGWSAAVVILAVGISLASTFYFPTFFDVAEQSNSIKLGHFTSYINEFENHPQYLIWGQGAETEFYSEGFGGRTTITELAYLEIIRNFGVPISLVLCSLLVWPIVWFVRQSKQLRKISYLAIPYSAYLVTAGSNPLLVSSTGFLVIVAMWGVVILEGRSRDLASWSTSLA
jgi:hypothetical protein